MTGLEQGEFPAVRLAMVRFDKARWACSPNKVLAHRCFWVDSPVP